MKPWAGRCIHMGYDLRAPAPSVPLAPRLPSGCGRRIPCHTFGAPVCAMAVAAVPQDWVELVPRFSYGTRREAAPDDPSVHAGNKSLYDGQCTCDRHAMQWRIHQTTFASAIPLHIMFHWASLQTILVQHVVRNPSLAVFGISFTITCRMRAAFGGPRAFDLARCCRVCKAACLCFDVGVGHCDSLDVLPRLFDGFAPFLGQLSPGCQARALVCAGEKSNRLCAG